MMRTGTFTPSVRYVGDITLYFREKNQVHVWNKNGTYFVVRRPFGAFRAVYSMAWKPFCERLYRRNTFDSIFTIAQIAARFDLDIVHPHYTVPPTVPPGTMVRPSHYDWGKKTRREKRYEKD